MLEYLKQEVNQTYTENGALTWTFDPWSVTILTIKAE